MYERYIPDEGFVEIFLRYDNRINRKRYIKRVFALVGISFILGIVVNIVLMILGADISEDTLARALGLLPLIPSWALMMRRLHDLNRPGWWVVGSLVPLLNFVLGLYLLFAKGTDGANQYGPDPLEV